MANRAMQAKVLKLKKQIRKLPKPYQHVYFTEGRSKNDPRDYELDPDKSTYAPAVQYRARGKGELEDGKKVRFPGIPPGRVEVLAHLTRIRTAIPDMIGFSLMDTSRLRAMLYRDSQSKTFIILEEDHRTGRVFSSQTYGDRGRIIEHWKKGTLRGVFINPKAGSSPSPA